MISSASNSLSRPEDHLGPVSASGLTSGFPGEFDSSLLFCSAPGGNGQTQRATPPPGVGRRKIRHRALLDVPGDSCRLLAERESVLADQRDGDIARSRVVTVAGSSLDLLQCHFYRQSGSVGAVADHRLYHVGDREHPCRGEDLDPRKPAG